jgi:tetratricopeptide (TPR) repeat protein
MSSIMEGYNYDIFISYRQKDNKGDRWVSEFVDSLKTELESTFKEEISVYFDINPHDGLLETHDVNASLKEKLKCLVFIPIISRTYCDPKSFAWEHEFKAFVEQASQDKFGMKIRLPNGNVASRVLPIRIYDLNTADIKQCESILGGVLRGIEFIYAEPGVNRPLKSDDDEKINLNKTKYRNQINKVGNAIKEVISGLMTEPIGLVQQINEDRKPFEEVGKEEKKLIKKTTAVSNKIKLISGAAIFTLLVIAGIFGYPKIFKSVKLEVPDGRISISIMPFQNMTNDTTWNVWQEGIQDMLVAYLSNSPDELKVRQIESINNLIQSKGIDNYSSITPSVANAISHKLNSDVFICGSIKRAGSKIRLNAQLIETKTEEVLKSFEIDGPYGEEVVFDITDSLRKSITDFLLISKWEEKVDPEIKHFATTKSPEAYKYFIYGHIALYKNDLVTAIKFYSQALAIDSNFTYATLHVAWSYYILGQYEEGKKWCLKAYENKTPMFISHKIYTNFVYAVFFETPYEAIKYLKQIQEINDQWIHNWYNMGWNYSSLGQYDKAITVHEKSFELCKKMGIKPWFAQCYTNLGRAYHKTRQYRKEKELYKKGEQDFPDDPLIIYRQAILSLTVGNLKAANGYLEKYVSIRKENIASEADLATSLAGIYSEADKLDKAEEYYRQALSLEPENPVRLNDLAYFLIDKDRNINEGLELVDKALELSPDNYVSFNSKGWGLFKQGKYKEALEILQKSWDLRREKAIYNHEAYLHLEAAKKTVAIQKNN